MSARRGVLVFVLAVVLLGFVVLVVAFNLRRGAAGRYSSEPAVLVFDVPAELEEGAPPPGPFPWSGRRRDRLTLYDVLRGMRAATTDDRVAGLVLHVDGVDWGWAKVGEVRDAVARFRASGKPVYASLTGGGEREYLLATAADRLGMPPTTTLMLDGLVASAVYYKGAFDKFGVSANFAHVGRYKSAVEPYTRGDMSPDSRAALGAMLDDIYGTLLEGIGAARAMSPDSVSRLIDEGPFTASRALRAGLVDTLIYDTEMDSLAVRHGRRRAPTRTFRHYVDDLDVPGTGPHVALVTASGEIVSGRSRETWSDGDVLGSETVIEALRQARTRKAVKAIVLRIDSPGGVADAADDIWREVERCRVAKPVIVSMSDLAASGGYYFAVAADSIVASPLTLTGSIGIFGGKYNILGLYRKIGLNVDTVTRGKHAGFLSPYRDFTPEEARLFQAQLESFYRGFVGRVARGRRLPEAAVDSVAQGRVWTGREALERGLVDRLGGLETAFAMARARAGIPKDAEIVVDRYPRVKRSFLERMLEGLWRDDDEAGLLESLPPEVRAWATVSRFPAGKALALMPWRIDVR